MVGCDGVHSVVRERLIGDAHRVSGHVVYRAVVPHADMPDDLRWNAAAIWVGPNCHLVHYPLRGGEQYNIVVTFHSREQEEWGVREGSRDEVHVVFHRDLRPAAPAARQADLVEALVDRRPRSGRPLGRRVGQRCSATPHIPCCNTWHRARASRWRMQ